jgi:hypothetical protein
LLGDVLKSYLGRGAGGAYIPPFKLAQMLKEVDDKASPEYQRMTWDALRKSINGLVNKVKRRSLSHCPQAFKRVQNRDCTAPQHRSTPYL